MTTMQHRIFTLAVLVAALFTSAASAQTLTWTGAGNGTSFGMATNWSPVSVPGANSDCIIPAGAGTIIVGNNAVIRSLSSARNLFIEGCANMTLTGNLVLDNGAVLQIDNTGGCTALVFRGGSQSISGTGSIFISSEGNGGYTLSVENAANLTIASPISIGYGPGSTGTSTYFYLGTGTSLINNGAVSINQPDRSLTINGPGQFINNGSLNANAGALSVQTGSWANNGEFRVGASASLKLSGLFPALGSIISSGGPITVSGSLSSSVLIATAASGPVTLSGVTLNSCTLESPDTTGFKLDGACTFNACTIGTDVTMECARITITNSLTFANNARLTSGPNCIGTSVTFSGGTQFLHGNGSLSLRGGSSSNDRTLSLAPNTSLTIDPGITVTSTRNAGPTRLVVDSGATLVNNGTIAADSSTFTLDASSANAQFVNGGTLAFGPTAVAAITGANWSNSGSITIDDSRFNASDNWTNSGTIVGVGATITAGGTGWTNNGSVMFINSAVSLSFTNWVNNADITSAYGTLNFAGGWINSGSVTSVDTALSMSGTFSALGTLLRTGGTVNVGSSNYTGASMIADAQTGDLLLSGTMTGTTLSSRDGSHLVIKGIQLTNCAIASDIELLPAGRIRVAGNLFLKNNASVFLGSPIQGGHTDGLVFEGGTPSITGSGSIIARLSYSFCTLANNATVTIGAGVTLAVGPDAYSTFTSDIEIPAGCTFINKGTITVRQPGCAIEISGAGLFKNQGILDLPTGTIDIRNHSGPLGLALIASGASLKVQGNYTIDEPIDCNGNLSLTGTWTNNSTITVTNGSLTLGGTWTNAGTFVLNSSPWTVYGSYSSLGNFVSNSSPLTYFGSIAAGKVLTADASTGDIFLDRVALTNSTLRAEGGAVFRIASGSGQFLNLNGCTLAGNLLAGNCGNITLTNGLTLANSAELSLESGESCGPAVLVVATGSQTIGGIGQISFRNLSFTTGSIQVQNNASLTIASGVSLICPNNSRSGGRITTSSLASLTNFGLISMRMPATSFVVGGTGTFNNSGTVESIAGDLVVNPTTLQNFDTTTLTLSGGKWISRGGSLTLGTRIIRNIGPGAVIDITGSSAAIPTLTSLRTIDGTLRLAARNITTAPANGTLYNSGLIDLAPDGVLTINGGITLNPSGTVRIEIKGASTGQFGRIKPSAAASVAGHLRGAFIAPYSPAPGTIFSPVVYGSPITGAFSDICFDDNPQHMSVTQNLVPFQLQLIPSTSSGFAPVITQQPDNAHASPDATFSVLAAPADATYQWRKGGTPLTDGPTPSGSTISGSQTASLTIHNAHPEDAGSYDALISNSCGSAISNSATLSVCTGDLNADGLVDDADFVLFLAGYNILDCADPTMPANCPADLNNDGVVDDADFVIFVPAYDALLCP
ncbi:MAG: immunoglobulin domain-containing protein [Phycisphaerae bacterium]|nr:immunoglobulin domain-containing protein [Phycisphaerae bacterium]